MKVISTDKNFVLKTERRVIETFKDTVFNKQIPSRTKNEYQRQYNEDNREKQKEYYNQNKKRIKEKQKKYDKQYREQNKEKIMEYRKQYYNQNKEILNEKIECEICGIMINKRHLKEHNNTRCHILNFINS